MEGALVLHSYHDCSARQGCSTGILVVLTLSSLYLPAEEAWSKLHVFIRVLCELAASLLLTIN